MDANAGNKSTTSKIDMIEFWGPATVICNSFSSSSDLYTGGHMSRQSSKSQLQLEEDLIHG